jgi:hypothetical protein
MLPFGNLHFIGCGFLFWIGKAVIFDTDTPHGCESSAAVAFGHHLNELCLEGESEHDLVHALASLETGSLPQSRVARMRAAAVATVGIEGDTQKGQAVTLGKRWFVDADDAMEKLRIVSVLGRWQIILRAPFSSWYVSQRRSPVRVTL